MVSGTSPAQFGLTCLDLPVWTHHHLPAAEQPPFDNNPLRSYRQFLQKRLAGRQLTVHATNKDNVNKYTHALT